MPELAGFEDFVEIGRGGFGVVYRAHQPALNRYVAIKFLAASLSSTGRERLSREALAMGALSGHPNIVAVVDVGIPVEGTPYLIMPYLARGSLADAMAASGPQPWPEVVRIGVKLAGALESAHRLGILHRDVKPGNVLVSDFGEPQLADFGLARVSGGFETTSRHITASVAHAAPEILEGRPPSAASDVYSLASTMYALVDGNPAFTARDDESLVALYVRIASSPVPEFGARGVPEALHRVLAAAMSKRPDERPTTAAEFGRMLQDLEAAEGKPVTELPIRDAGPAASPAPRASTVVSGPTRVTSRARRRRPWIWAAVAAAAVLVLGATIWAINDSPSDTTPPEASDTSDAGATADVNTSPTADVSCLAFPQEVPWYQTVDELATHPKSADYIASIRAAPRFDPKEFHADFGTDFGATYNVIDGAPPSTLVPNLDGANEADLDPGPYPIPVDAVASDSYLIVVDNSTCTSHELLGEDEFSPWNSVERAASFDLNAAPDRPDGSPGMIQSGLPLFPMAVRYDEVAQGEIDHALLFNAPVSSSRFMHPATRGVSDGSADASIPPLGSRFRLEAEFDCGQLVTSEGQTICETLKTYGMYLGGSSGALFALQGVADARWDDESIHEDFELMTPEHFEVVDTGEPVL
jgi:serine/threonine protein kinase